MIEITGLRSERNKVFDLGSGKRRMVCHGKPIHYKVGAELKDIERDIQVVDKYYKGTFWKYGTEKGIYQAYFNGNKARTAFVIDGHALVQEPYAIGWYDHQTHNWGVKQLLQDSTPIVNGETITYPNSFHGIDIEYTYDNHKLKEIVKITETTKQYVIDNFADVPNKQNKWFVIANKLKLYDISPYDGNAEVVDDITLNELLFKFADKLEFFFPLGKAWDSNTPEKAEFDVKWRVIKHNGEWYILYGIPFSWFQDKVFPIYVDPTTTIYSKLWDGWVEHHDNEWSVCRNAETGSSDNDSVPDAMIAIVGSLTDVPEYKIYRSFFCFDTSGIGAEATINSVNLMIYGRTYAQSDVCAMKGTQANTLTSADYDAFTGSEYGHVNWAAEQYNTISFNEQGIADINKVGDTKICCREYTHEYSNSIPDGYNTCGVYYSNNTGTDKDPKVVIDYSMGLPKSSSAAKLITNNIV